ncbi:MAG TPA: O-antigen ligase family protein [Stellaceae bacterium]|nr:O-antigen ligase family protein [Stellaceae bacterium]
MAGFKINAFLIMLAGYTILGYSFMLLRVPPVDFGAPIGEVLLLIFLLSTNLPLFLDRLGKTIPLTPLALFWGLASVRLVVGFASYGMWALRDASHFLNSLFILVGFVLAGNRENWEKLWRWFPMMLIVASLYSFTFIWGEAIRAGSPTLSGASGQLVPIFGVFASGANVLLVTAIYLMVDGEASKRRWSLPFAMACLAFAFIIFQARTTYFQLVVLMALLFLYRRGAMPRLLILAPVFFVAVAIIMVFDFKIPGRIADQISFGFFFDHILASFGISGSEDVSGAAYGVDQRLSWWRDALGRLFSDPVSTFTGLGYGIPLVQNFVNAEGVAVREPHNSIVSVLSRLGVLGLTAFLALNLVLFRAGVQCMAQMRRRGWRQWEDRLLVMFAYFAVTFVMALTEDAFEKPYLTIPYYAFWGFVLRLHYETKRVTAEDRAAHPGVAEAKA